MPHLWNPSRLAWRGLWATWSSWRCLLIAGALGWMTFRAPFQSRLFYDSLLPWIFSCISLHGLTLLQQENFCQFLYHSTLVPATGKDITCRATKAGDFTTTGSKKFECYRDAIWSFFCLGGFFPPVDSYCLRKGSLVFFFFS